MREEEDESADLEPFPATIHCRTCGRWLCDDQAEDALRHPCMLPTGDTQ
jgi:hypothetical protein